jgi:large subunit ribosomal protein L11
MAKKVRAVVRIQLEAGKATPAPPVGPALGQHAINIMQFCKEYNERPPRPGDRPGGVTVLGSAPYLRPQDSARVRHACKAAEWEQPAQKREKVSTITQRQLREIATARCGLNAADVEAAERDRRQRPGAGIG